MPLARRAAVPLALLLAFAAHAHAQDLTGFWRDDVGGRYAVRQGDGGRVCWHMNNAPGAVHVFCGRIGGDELSGTWMDVPGSRVQQIGDVTFRVESADRLVRTGSTVNYAGRVLTREGTSGGGAGGGGGGGAGGGAMGGGDLAIDWAANAQDKGDVGQRVTFRCPGGGRLGSVWGTDVYTDDSSVCSAAVHAGMIGLDGGAFTVELLGGRTAYAGSYRNGVTSSGYGAWDRSFSFVGRAIASGPAAIPAGWGTNATELRGRTGTRFLFFCPGRGTPGSIWGSGPYTDDSSICTAGVHAGAITMDMGGFVTIEIRPGATAYSGSRRNGVTTGDYGTYAGSFVVLR